MSTPLSADMKFAVDVEITAYKDYTAHPLGATMTDAIIEPSLRSGSIKGPVTLTAIEFLRPKVPVLIVELY